MIRVFLLHEAQLYWDRQDPSNEGWYLRYRDEFGDEQSGYSIDAAKDASMEELGAAVESALGSSGATGEIRVFRGDEQCGRLTLRDGECMDWRAS